MGGSMALITLGASKPEARKDASSDGRNCEETRRRSEATSEEPRRGMLLRRSNGQGKKGGAGGTGLTCHVPGLRAERGWGVARRGHWSRAVGGVGVLGRARTGRVAYDKAERGGRRSGP